MAFPMLRNVTLFNNLNNMKGGNKFNLLQASNFVATLITIAITIMDMGVDYNLNEISFYRNPIVQLIGVFAVGYSSTDGNMMLTLLLTAIWFFIKHRFNFDGFMKQEDPEDAYKTTVKHLLRKLKSNNNGNVNLN